MSAPFQNVDSECHELLHLVGPICPMPIYVYGAFIAYPPNYLLIGRADAFEKGQSSGAQGCDRLPNDKNKRNGLDAKDNAKKITGKAKPRIMTADCITPGDPWPVEPKPYKEAVGHWMMTMDGRTCQDPGFNYPSYRKYQ